MDIGDDDLPDTSCENERVRAIVDWFFAHYERPEENTPRDSGDWVWIHGGPHDARDEIEAHFEVESDVDRARAISLIEAIGVCEWAGRDNGVDDVDDGQARED